MQTADFDHNDFKSGMQSKADEQLLVKFFIKEVKNHSASLESGRPIFREVEYIDIKIPGNRTGGACRPATHRDRQRFPRHYDAFKQRVEPANEGTPLNEWPVITRSQAEELSFYNVKTVEQLIAMSDSNASQFMGVRDLKTKAAKWLEDADESARINQIEKLEAENKQLNDSIAALTARLDKLDTTEIVKSAAKKPQSKKV